MTSNDADVMTLPGDQVRAIRRALVLGLTCLGIIEEAKNAAEIARMSGKELPKGVEPVHPLGSPDGIGIFAEALAYL